MDLIKHLFFLKVFIPRRVQIMLRRMLVKKILPSYQNVWPIDQKSAKAPEGWAGWPEGKKFAIVLTHDIDTQKGHDKCLSLAKIEEQLGFRSSFNFVAEDYNVSRRLLESLSDRGFEIGNHSIHHKNPFISKQHFQNLAIKINKYLKEWNAVGFRSPSMYHNLDWIQELNILYDASTFDTDPFEPQSDGVGTIFPFWVAGKNQQKGYVELPYTLPQDFLLYILMQQKNIDIWKTKLDWIANHGGMCLFITHPDYMAFDGITPNYTEFPATYYEQFLNYINAKYKEQFWHVLPRDLAKWIVNEMNKK